METFSLLLLLLKLGAVFTVGVKNDTCHDGCLVPSLVDLARSNEIEQTNLIGSFKAAVSKSFHAAPKSLGNFECSLHSEVIYQQANELESWALKIVDASAKIPSGILNGNLNQYGDFDLCLSAQGVFGKQTIRGKYCLANVDIKIAKNQTNERISLLNDLVHSHRIIQSGLLDHGHRIPKFETFNWGLCLPNTCTNVDFKETLSRFLNENGNQNIVQFEVEVIDELCYEEKNRQLSTGTYLSLCFFFSLVVLVGCGSLLGMENPDDSTFIKAVKCFSLKKNITILMDTDPPKDDIPVLHGGRFLNALALLLSHKQMAFMFNPFINRTEMAEMLGKSWSMIGRSAILYTDSFVIISGLLASYSFVKELDKNKKIDVKEKYISRFLRFTPNLFVVIIFCTYIMEHLGIGPQWGLVVDRYSGLCKKNMWKNLLYIHNYFGFENMCLTHTHQLGIDMQLFLVSPFLSYLLWKYPKRGMILLGVLALSSTFLRYVVTYRNEISTLIHYGISVDRLWKTANLSYILPTHRITVYSLGLLLGYYVRRGGFRLKFTTLQLVLGWTSAVYLGLFAMLGPYHVASKNYSYNVIDAARYNAFSPILWGAFLTWILLACSNGYGGWLEKVLAWKYFIIFTRISYALYLVQFPVFFYNVGVQRTAQYYSGLHSMMDLVEFSTILVASVALTLFVDLPFQNLKRVLNSSSRVIKIDKEIKGGMISKKHHDLFGSRRIATRNRHHG